MFPKRFALIGGILMLAMGALALIPSMVGPVDGLPVLYVQDSYGWFLNMIPMNIFNKVALIVFGIAGIVAANMKFTNLPWSIFYSRVVFFAMGALAILGLIPQTNTLFGYWPLFGADVIVHAVFAIAGAYFGYALSSKVPDSGPVRKNFDGPLAGTR